MPASLDRFRVSMKFSLWMWALYWPGGGILLLMGGLDMISILVIAGTLTCFVLLLTMGGLRADSSRTLRQFLLERPMYLIAGFIALVFLAPVFGAMENFGLRLFSTLYLAAIILVGVRMWQHQRTLKGNVVRTGTDQVFLLVGLMGVASLFVFLDAWLPLVGLGPLPGISASVAAVNWINFLYPPLLMLTTRPFRDPLRWPSHKEPDEKAGKTTNNKKKASA